MVIHKFNLDRKSLRGQFNLFLIVIFLLVSLVFLISNLISFHSLNRYRNTVSQYTALSDFYSNTALFSQGIVNYLYTGKEDELDFHKMHMERAEDNLTDLNAYKNPEWQFRLGLLSNMLDTYKEHVAAILTGVSTDDLLSQYNSLDRLRELIDDTYSQYARLLTSLIAAEQIEMIRLWKTQFRVTIFLFLVMIAISIQFSVQSVRSITNPLGDMIENMNRIKDGEFRINSISASNREIIFLLESFEEMAGKIRSYVEQIKETSLREKQLVEAENENLKTIKTLTESKLLALQEQMNPHFLFNTLSMISRQAYIEGAPLTSELMVKTATMLRYSMEMSSKISDLGKEIECIGNYFEIQKRRMGDRVVFSIAADDDLDKIRMPGMILQPLVENCIIHGIKDMTEGAAVSVEIRRDGQTVFITVEDNGRGIEAEKLESLNNIDPADPAAGGIGLKNIRQRLELYFKKEYLFFLESHIECGTVATLSIPCDCGGML